MDTMSEVFLQYMNYLEKEHEIKTDIQSAIRSLETVSYAITLQMERMHNNVNDENILRTCELINKELLKAKEAYKLLSTVVPVNQFYRYNYLFRNHTQKMVQATALLIYFSENRLVKLEEVASLLGLKSFEISLQIQENGLNLKQTAAVDTGTSNPKTKEAARASELKLAGRQGFEETASGTEQEVFTGLEEPVKASKCVMNLATSSTGTKLILTPSSPRPSRTSTSSGDFLPSCPSGDKSESRSFSICSEDSHVECAFPYAAEKGIVSDDTDDPADNITRGRTCSTPETGLERDDSAVVKVVPQVAADGSSQVKTAVTNPDDAVTKVLRPRSRCESSDNGNGCNVLRGRHSPADASLSLHLDIEDFLIGCLMIGSELARLAVNAVSTGNFGLPFCINQFLRELHAGYTQLHLKNSFLRKTYDELKYSLKKTEDVVYNLSLRGLKPVDPAPESVEEQRVDEAVAGEGRK